MKKITFINDEAPYLSAENLNLLQDNIEESIDEINKVIISSTKPTTGEEVWLERSGNIFDGQIESGSINIDGDGGNVVNSSRTRSVNYMKVSPNTIYVFKREVTTGYRWVVGYNSNKEIIKDGIQINQDQIMTGATAKIGVGIKNATFTTTPTTEYIRWYDTESTNTEEIVVIERKNKKIHTKNDNGVYEEFYNEEEHSSKILWTNPNPTSTFNAQTINLSSNDYDYLEVFYKDYMTNKLLMSERFYKGYGTTINFAGKRVLADKTYVGNFIRNIVYVNDTTFDVSGATYIRDGETTSTSDERYNIPIYIVGHKL